MTPWLWVAIVAFCALVWTWALYPVVIWLASRIVRLPARVEPSVLPRVTAIVATRDDTATIAARVEDFLRADYPVELLSVVVGLDSTGATRLDEIRAACGAVNVVVVAGETAGGKAAGLNAAVQAAGGDVLVFSDAQQRFAPDAIRVLVARLHCDARLGAVSGALQLPGDRADVAGRSPVEWYWFLERVLRAAEARLHSAVGVSGSIYAMWRRDWRPMPDLLILDDLWLPMRLVLAGRRVGYELDARAWDARSTTAAQEKVRKVRTLTGNFQLMAWLPGLLIPIRNPIWLQFVSHKVARLLTPWLMIALLIGGIGAVWHLLSATVVYTLLTIMAAAVTAVLIAPRTRGVAVRAVVWSWSLQLAVVQATMNGLRGRWDVWR
jgi:poly-beta-1,6-N-acetyl-D-glucosamine synthase